MNKEKIFVKKVRAKSKARYYKFKQPECFICGKTDGGLELHHIQPLANIVSNYLKTIEKGDKTDAELVDEIIANCQDIFDPDNLVTLCKLHHYYLHNLFGMSYSAKVADKVKTYLIKQKEKYNG